MKESKTFHIHHLDQNNNGTGLLFERRSVPVLPCLSSKSLKLLVATADERYSFSPEYFRQTHYPQVLHKYYQHQLVQEITEKELFDELQEDTAIGNRVYTILGSTGSGKSELLCWLRDQCIQQNVYRPVIRLSRTELNPQLLITRCYEALQISEDKAIDDSKWHILLQKPITIINQIVWSTLAEFFDSDEEIVPLALLLRPIIEQNIKAFAQQVKEKNIVQSLEIISEEQLDEIKRSTALPISIPYQSFRHSLRKKLEQFLFSGHDMISILKQLSHITMKKNIRPLILIDDLVQSINIYASELLDYFITLEEGNWDVVIGLTPGALQDSEKGTTLMSRILNLDTIDDRIQKLWLTDESGQVFYTLGRNDAVPYLEKYLIELKSTQGFVCNSNCPHAINCSRFLVGKRARLSLLPLNEPLIERIYDGVPSGKGKLRYTILHTREIIRFLLRGTSWGLSRVEALIDRNVYANHPYPLLKILGEMFADHDTDHVFLPEGWVKHCSDQSTSLTLSLQTVKRNHSSLPFHSMKHEEEATPLLHLRDWIEGKKVNEELIYSLRGSIATLIHDAIKAIHISRRFTPRQSAVLQRSEISKGIRYPVSFSAVEKKNEIKVHRSVILLKMYGFQQQKTSQRKKIFSDLSNSWDVAEWIYQGEMVSDQWLTELEKSLGLPTDEFAFQLLTWINSWLETCKYSSVLSLPSIPISQETQKWVEEFFLDWFALRDNIIDATKINKIKVNPDFETFFLSRLFPKNLECYRLVNVSLYTFLTELQQAFQLYQSDLRTCLKNKCAEYETMTQYIQNYHPSINTRIKTICQQIKQQEPNPNLIKEVANLETHLLNHGIYESYNHWLKQKEASQQLLNSLIHPLVADRNWTVIPKSLEQMLEYISMDSQLPPSTRDLLLSIINKGEYIISLEEVSDVLTSLYKHCPRLIQYLHLQIKLKSMNN
ncbi:hypothetical protein [Laceyella tengchongensis]|uniref:hypothetical protein n=1 Tax=Laceyella tengchongensis TaxID=574699 RepID=UPI002546723B|nr:hypothetical protein [Laceyella tengchongensis]